MKYIIDIFRRFVVSPEFLVAVSAVLVIKEEPAWVTDVSKLLVGAPDGVKYLSLAPVAVSVWCLRQSRIILFPSEDSKGILQEWPKFQRLKERVFIGLAYQAIYCSLGIATWIRSPSLSNGNSVAVMAMSIIGSLIGAVTFYLSGIMASEITKRYATKI